MVKCPHCGYCYIYDPQMKLLPELLVLKGKETETCFKLSRSCILGRNQNGYFNIIGELDNSCINLTTIRNPYITREHSKIEVRNVTEIIKINGEDTLLEKKSCSIRDCNSTNGTAVNGEPLRPNEYRVLSNEDEIVLALFSPMPLKIKYRLLL